MTRELQPTFAANYPYNATVR